MLVSDLILKRALRRRGSNLKAPVITDTEIQKEQMNKNRLVSGSSVNRRENASFSRKCVNKGLIRDRKGHLKPEAVRYFLLAEYISNCVLIYCICAGVNYHKPKYFKNILI